MGTGHIRFEDESEYGRVKMVEESEEGGKRGS
jgi:hypothetical protein